MGQDLSVLHVVGARPNFMKIAPVLRAFAARPEVRSTLVHTGQHYDDPMSRSFFRDLAIPDADIDLGVGSGTHAQQTAAVLNEIEPVMTRVSPDLVMVVGDVNSTLAAALAAVKIGIPVAHLEAGLRSGDRSMPEEINRVLTDQISEICLTPSRDADLNLAAEGIADHRIRFVGNVMIDTLLAILPEVRNIPEGFDLEPRSYALATLHRPSNVDQREVLSGILTALDSIAEQVPVVFPIHPRTRQRMGAFDLRMDRVRVVEPLGYKEMLALQASAGLVLTDSGGIQEETTVLGVPCLTLRSSTERPITISEGTNHMVANRSTDGVLQAFRRVWGTACRRGQLEGWDGRAAERVADAVLDWWSSTASK